jgi:hypothetical protein
MGKMKEEWIRLKREEEWRIEQYNRNRPSQFHVRTIEELEKKLKELKQE